MAWSVVVEAPRTGGAAMFILIFSMIISTSSLLSSSCKIYGSIVAIKYMSTIQGVNNT